MRRLLGALLLSAALAGCIGSDASSSTAQEDPPQVSSPRATGSTDATIQTWPNGSVLLHIVFEAPEATEITLEGNISASWDGQPSRNTSGPVTETNWSQVRETDALVFVLWSGTGEDRELVRVRTMACTMPLRSSAMVEVRTPVGSHREEWFVGGGVGASGGCAVTRGEEGLELPADNGPYHLVAIATNATGLLNRTSVDYTLTADAPLTTSVSHGGRYHLVEDTTFDPAVGASAETLLPPAEARASAQGSVEMTTAAQTLLIFYPALGTLHQAVASYTPPDHGTITYTSVPGTVRGPPGQGSGAYIPGVGLGPAGAWTATTHTLSCADLLGTCDGLFLLAELTDLRPLHGPSATTPTPQS